MRGMKCYWVRCVVWVESVLVSGSVVTVLVFGSLVTGSCQYVAEELFASMQGMKCYWVRCVVRGVERVLVSGSVVTVNRMVCQHEGKELFASTVWRRCVVSVESVLVSGSLVTV
ncbi:hypothetical protein TNCV_226081 [Trichonephila clavipes]|nr:hypothetical protein TNCV_226081 [Trichonephila clavipes]